MSWMKIPSRLATVLSGGSIMMPGMQAHAKFARVILTLIVLTVHLVDAASSAQTADRRPNVILIVARRSGVWRTGVLRADEDPDP